MADSNYPYQTGQQMYSPQPRPQFPPNINQNQPGGQGSAPQGGAKLGGAPPYHPQMSGPPLHGQPPAVFPGGPVGRPPAPGPGVNGFAPPQGPGPRGVVGRPPGPAPQFLPSGGMRPPVSAPPAGFNGPQPSINGNNTPPLGPGAQPPHNARFQPPQPSMPQAGSRPPLSQPPSMPPAGSRPPLSQPPTSAPLPRMTGPPFVPGNAPPSTDSGSGTSTPVSSQLSSPNELPVPFHGQAQYSHQVGSTMKITPTPTPTTSEPPSQKTSRDPSPVSEQTMDALEGQFSPGQAPSPGHPPNRGSPFQSSTPGSQSPFLHTQGKATPPLPGQSTPPRPGAGMAGSTQGMGGVGMASAQPPSQPGINQGPPRPGFSAGLPFSGSGYQPGPQTRPPGPPTMPGAARPPGLSQGPPVSSQAPGLFNYGAPPTSSAASAMRGPGQALPGHYGPGPPQAARPTGPPSGPFNLGPPSSTGPPSGPPLGSFNQGPPSSTAPPTGPPSGPFNLGPPSSSTAPPTGSFSQGPPSSSVPPPGPPSGPFNLGPPMPGSAPPPGAFSQGAPSSSKPGPPSGPPSGPFNLGPPSGPPSGPTGPPSGPAGVGPRPGYPQPAPGQNPASSMAGDFNRMGINDSQRAVNLLQEKQLIPAEGVEVAKPNLFHDNKRANCNSEVFQCTLNAIPQTSALLNKARLPLGILIHPFKDLSQLPVIQSSVIVRCRSCRTYINPFVVFVDQRRWKCNLCFRVNDLPDEFSFDPVTKSYGEPQRRPEIRSATIEFIAPSEYMLRPPQPAVYLFLLDVSQSAIESGYLHVFTQTLIEEIDRLPGDARAQIGFMCYDSSLYFFNLSEGLSQPQMMVVPDLEDIFLPCPDSLMVNLHERRDMIVELLSALPKIFSSSVESGNALGSALQAAFKLMTTTGGRVTVLQTSLPSVGQGVLTNRETATKNASQNTALLGPASDFYKKLALDCSAQQIAVDLFMLNKQYADIATVSCISKYSGGCVHYYPGFHVKRNPAVTDKFESDLRRYLTRKIGFEAVMRIRCTRGVSIHTFHGNFFVRSTDLLSLPNVNPDAGFGMQMSIEENLVDSSNVCFQAALLYTSSKGERRIRVHSLCVPVTNQLSEVFAGADQQAIASLLAKMAVDRSVSSSLEDARDGLMNACQDMLSAYAAQVPANQRVGAVLAPYSLRLVPLFTLALLKSVAFKLTSSARLDDRVFGHLQAKCQPCLYLLQNIYPHLYPVHNLPPQQDEDDDTPSKAPRLQLSSANLDRHGVYIMDQGDSMYMFVGGAVSDSFCQSVFDVPNFNAIPDGLTDLPELANPVSERLRSFVGHLMDSRPGGLIFVVLREDSSQRHLFFQHMVEDRTENSKSYYEFLQFLQSKVKG